MRRLWRPSKSPWRRKWRLFFCFFFCLIRNGGALWRRLTHFNGSWNVLPVPLLLLAVNDIFACVDDFLSLGGVLFVLDHVLRFLLNHWLFFVCDVPHLELRLVLKRLVFLKGINFRGIPQTNGTETVQ